MRFDVHLSLKKSRTSIFGVLAFGLLVLGGLVHIELWRRRWLPGAAAPDGQFPSSSALSLLFFFLPLCSFHLAHLTLLA